MPKNRRIRCDYDHLANLANQFAQEADQTAQMLQQIRNCVGNLQSGDWIGQGANRFYMEMEDLLFPALQRLVQALEDTGNGISQVGNLFSQAEQEASGRILQGASATIVSSGPPAFQSGGAYMSAASATQSTTPQGPQLGSVYTRPGFTSMDAAVGATPLPIPDPD